MKVILMANDWGGVRVLDFLQEYGEKVVGLVIHNPEKRNYTGELVMKSKLPNKSILTTRELKIEKGVKRIKELKPDIIVCAFFQGTLTQEIIDIPKHGCINICTRYLPFNKGPYSNEYPILDDSPAGVTINVISNEEMDTGPIITRKVVPVLSTDTGGSLHIKLVNESIELFFKTWCDITLKRFDVVEQKYLESAVTHLEDEIDRISQIFPLEEYSFIDLIDVIRARTYPPNPGCYYIDPDTGKKIYIWVKLMFEEDLRGRNVPQ